MWLILPAGYLGSSVFGSLLILLGSSVLRSKIAAVLLVLGMLIALWWAKNWLTRGLTLASIATLVSFAGQHDLLHHRSVAAL